MTGNSRETMLSKVPTKEPVISQYTLFLKRWRVIICLVCSLKTSSFVLFRAKILLCPKKGLETLA